MNLKNTGMENNELINSNNLPGLVFRFRLDKNGNWGFEFLGGNSSFLSELGIDVELIKQNAELALNFIPPEDIKKLNSKLHASAKNLSLFEWEGEFKLFSTQNCWLKFSASPIMADE